MDPVTHFLTGATLARTGFNRKAAYATLAMTLAAETPDLDILWGFRGPVPGFLHHRGITHTFLALPFEGMVVLGAVYLVHRIRVSRVRPIPAPSEPTADQPVPQPITSAPIRWALLYGFILVALLSHLLLDWTNNYGIRPFFPFNPHWYQLSIVFIIEPLILLVLAVALLAPPLFGLISGEIGARRTPFRGRGWAIFAMLFIVALWALRFVEHDASLTLAANATYGRPGSDPTQVLRVFSSPAPINPFKWHTVAETPGFFQLATADTRRGVVDTDPELDLLPKPASTPSTDIAKRSPLGQAYLDWSSWPLVNDLGPMPLPTTANADPAPRSGASAPELPDEVLFRDLRFLYDAPTIDWHQNPPLAGQVFIDLNQPESQRVVAMYLNGKSQP